MRIKLFCLCLTLTFATCAIAVAEASAEPEQIYKVNGVNLEAGKTKEITFKAKTEIVIEGEELGAKWVLKCKKLKPKASEKPVIVGGKPGASEKEKWELEECTATFGGTACASVTLETAQVNNELVRIAAPAGRAGDLATLFRPAAGTTFLKIKFKCGIIAAEINVEDDTAALIVPEKTEVTILGLAWKGSEPIKEVVREIKETPFKVGLMASGHPVTLNGEIEVELVSKEKWGAF
jgi:hypothetical protein